MEDLLAKIVSLCKRRGFVFQNSEIYGGMAGFFDYGPLGVELKNNIKKAWWQEMVQKREKVVGIEGAIICHPKVWQASGHVEGFSDPLVECKNCHKRFRADHLREELEIKETGAATKDLIEKLAQALKGIKCPECQGELTEPRLFNLLVEAKIGVIEEQKKKIYLRGEACQNIYLNYQNVLNSQRMKIPFGIAQIGKAFRNEITPKNFLYRQREFEQWDLQWFCHKREIKKWFEYWKNERMNWYQSLFSQKENLRFREHKKEELAHYAKRAVDIEYKTPFGWKELEGIHWRGDWDLSRHGKYSKKDFSYKDPKTGQKFIPQIIETSGGVDRTFLFLLFDSYQEIKGGRTKTTKATKEIEIVLKLPKFLAPVKVAVLPLVKNKPQLVKKARKVYQMLLPHFSCQYDEVDTIGRRYRRQDEIGTPYCLTIDFESLKNDDLTIRDRDTMEQERIKIKDLIKVLKEKLESY
jgi:glycyl-tRNA synthetase